MSSGSRILYRVVQASSTKIISRPATTTTTMAPRCDNCSNSEMTEIKGVIFDMDGTMTIPVLNFRDLHTRLNIAPGVDILPTIFQYSPEEKAQAMRVIEEFEDEGIKNMRLQPSLLDLLHSIAERGVRRGLMTRNAWKATQAFLDKLQQELVTNQDKYPHLSKDNLFSEVSVSTTASRFPYLSALSMKLEYCCSWLLPSSFPGHCPAFQQLLFILYF